MEDEVPIGDDERRKAVERLRALHLEGVLGPHDYEDRRGRALDARSQEELDELFRDLPPAGQGAVAPASAPPPAREPGAPGAPWFTKARRDALSWIVVFAAVFLFFRTGSWLWFLLIPASAAFWKLLSGRED